MGLVARPAHCFCYLDTPNFAAKVQYNDSRLHLDCYFYLDECIDYSVRRMVVGGIIVAEQKLKNTKYRKMDRNHILA